MKNTFGQAVTLTIFGESHGPAVGVVLDGLAPGLPVDEECIRRQLARRALERVGGGERCAVHDQIADHRGVLVQHRQVQRRVDYA